MDADKAADLTQDCELDAPPEQVWRAISIAEFREQWLPSADLAEAVPGERVGYRMIDQEPPHLESVVTFEISGTAAGGTRLRVMHRLTDARVVLRMSRVANDNLSMVMRAA